MNGTVNLKTENYELNTMSFFQVQDDWVKSILTIDQLTTEFLGSYTVTASNHYGLEYTAVTIKEGM